MHISRLLRSPDCVQILRFGAGAAPFNFTHDGGGQGEAFVKAYYATYSKNKMELGPYYRANSRVNFARHEAVGLEAIGTLITTVLPNPNPSVGQAHNVETVDVLLLGEWFLVEYPSTLTI